MIDDGVKSKVRSNLSRYRQILEAEKKGKCPGRQPSRVL